MQVYRLLCSCNHELIYDMRSTRSSYTAQSTSTVQLKCDSTLTGFYEREDSHTQAPEVQRGGNS